MVKRYPEAEEVFLTEIDEQLLLKESKEKLIIASVENSNNLDQQAVDNIDALLKDH